MSTSGKKGKETRGNWMMRRYWNVVACALRIATMGITQRPPLRLRHGQTKLNASEPIKASVYEDGTEPEVSFQMRRVVLVPEIKF